MTVAEAVVLSVERVWDKLPNGAGVFQCNVDTKESPEAAVASKRAQSAAGVG